jgi:biopolymer transport protein ExbB/TolQ
MGQWWHNAFVATIEWILLLGAVMTAIGIGLKRIYSMARGVEKIVEFTVSEKAEREKLALELKHHIDKQDTRNQAHDRQIVELVDNMREVSREIRPNGGSSMKDVVNNTNKIVNEMHTRVAVLEEWKRLEERA